MGWDQSDFTNEKKILLYSAKYNISLYCFCAVDLPFKQSFPPFS